MFDRNGERTSRHARPAHAAAAHWISQSLEQILQGHVAAQTAHFLTYAVSTQQIARSAMCPDDTKRNAALRELAEQLMQHQRAREIDIRRCR